MKDYFCRSPTYDAEMFCCRYSMRPSVFHRVQRAIVERNPYFTQQVDAMGLLGLTPLQKMTSALRQLAVGSSADSLNEYLRMAPKADFEINGVLFHQPYYLGDGIYLRWPLFVKSISSPTTPRRKYFAKRQEGARKDIERAFGVLRARWHILKNPCRLWHRSNMNSVISNCIILHNLIVEDEQVVCLIVWIGRVWKFMYPRHLLQRIGQHNIRSSLLTDGR